MNKDNSMINPSIVDLLKRVDNRYSLVVATSRRARQIIDGEERLVTDKEGKPLTIAINEVNEGIIDVTEEAEVVEELEENEIAGNAKDVEKGLI